MKYLIITMLLCALALPVLSQESNEPVLKEPTHILQLKQPHSDKPIGIQVKLTVKENKKLICNIMPDGQLMEAEYVISKDNKFKFQWAAIKRDGVVTIQYIGDKMEDGSFKGVFVALVDGELRKDMSGEFTLKKINPSK